MLGMSPCSESWRSLSRVCGRHDERMPSAAINALLFCFAGVLLEAVCAGGDIRARLHSLRKPRFVPSLWGWVVIGVAYYVVCFVVLWRLFLLGADVPSRGVAIALALAFMAINALWNYFVFRTRNLLHCLLIGAACSVVALMFWTVCCGSIESRPSVSRRIWLISDTRTFGATRSEN